jgi:hypothetical protein
MQQEIQHFGIIIVPQKNADEIAQRVGVLVNILTIDEIKN